jgi:antitoxin component YwqK of YwqJK toxin-antitoxin module
LGKKRIQNYLEEISLVKINFRMLIILVSVLFVAAFTGCNKPVPLPHAVLAANSIDIEKAKPISKDILNFNSLRRAAAITEVGEKWQIAPTSLIIMDGPALVVLIDEQRNAVKVIEHYDKVGGWGGRVSNRVTEYTISGGSLSGKAATWKGVPLCLFTTQTYKDNVPDGPTTYYSKDGRIICICEFRKGEPWSGRSLYYYDYDHIQMDVSYQEGKLNGTEWTYSPDGQPTRLKTWRMGVLHGLQFRYEGCLRNEQIYENGILCLNLTWYDNGQLEWDEEYDIDGKTGRRCLWDCDGKLILEENLWRGKYHGRRWERGHGNELWWWDNEILKNKAEFDSLSALYKKDID